MNIKEQAYKLHLIKLSYKEIADKLGISKTRAFEYVKEVKLSKGIFFWEYRSERIRTAFRTF